MGPGVLESQQPRVGRAGGGLPSDRRRGEPDALSWLPVDAVKFTFRTAFPDIVDDGTELNWAGAGSYFQVTWPTGSRPRHTLGVFVSCGWSLLDRPEVIERLRAVGRALGCGAFDPPSGAWSS